jgi:hypothetical protein
MSICRRWNRLCLEPRFLVCIALVMVSSCASLPNSLVAQSQRGPDKIDSRTSAKRSCSAAAVGIGLASGLNAYLVVLGAGIYNASELHGYAQLTYFWAALRYGAFLPVVGAIVGCAVGTVPPKNPAKDPLDRIDWSDSVRSYRWKP